MGLIVPRGFPEARRAEEARDRLADPVLPATPGFWRPY